MDNVEQTRALVKFALSIALSPILSQKLSSGEANTLDSTNCVLLPHNEAPRPDRQRINVSANIFTSSTGPAQPTRPLDLTRSSSARCGWARAHGPAPSSRSQGGRGCGARRSADLRCYDEPGTAGPRVGHRLIELGRTIPPPPKEATRVHLLSLCCPSTASLLLAAGEQAGLSLPVPRRGRQR